MDKSSFAKGNHLILSVSILSYQWERFSIHEGIMTVFIQSSFLFQRNRGIGEHLEDSSPSSDGTVETEVDMQKKHCRAEFFPRLERRRHTI